MNLHICRPNDISKSQTLEHLIQKSNEDISAMATQPDESVVLISSNFPSTVQGGQAFPATVMQPAGTVMFLMQGDQQVGTAPNQPKQTPQVMPLEKFRQAETKTLGAIQIMIGLIHIGFGAISFVLLGSSYSGIASTGVYLFWGGLFFIISGSLSVNAVKHLGNHQVRCSVGLNITSAVMSLLGIGLYIAEFIITLSLPYEHSPEISPIGIGLSALLFLFSLLEFCIAVSTAHFGCQATYCNKETNIQMVPYIIPEAATSYPESSAPPYSAPPYSAPPYSAQDPSHADLKG